MNMFVKVMRQKENIPDSHFSAPYALYTAKNVDFFKVGKHSVVFIDKEKVEFDGNVYVMNEHGKTIATYTHQEPRKSAEIKS